MYSTRPGLSMINQDFSGFETTHSFTLGYKKIGLSFNYLKGKNYWGWGFGVTQKDFGYSITKTHTTLNTTE